MCICIVTVKTLLLTTLCLFPPKSVNQNDFWKNLALCFQVLCIQIHFKNSIGPCQTLSIYCQQMALIKPAPVSTHTHLLSTSLTPNTFVSLKSEGPLVRILYSGEHKAA